MIRIDRYEADRLAFDRRFAEMKSKDAYRRPEGAAYALCLADAFDLLTAVLYLRERGGSVLLIPGATPEQTARETAGKAGCAYLAYGTWDRICELPADGRRRERTADPALLQYSSGTTGEPKLIARGWQLVEQEIRQYNERISALADARPVVLVPVSHAFGLVTGALAALARGAQPVIVQDKNPKFALGVLASESRHLVYAVPYLMQLMLELDKRNAKFHRVVLSGAPPTDPLLRRLSGRTDEIWHQYGCTEAGCISLGDRPRSAADVGTPLGHIRISIEAAPDREAERGRTAGAGEVVASVGETVVRTGDLGRVDEATGRLQVLGRMDDVINVSGLKVLPSEVEAVLTQMPGVREAVVHRTVHNVWGEAVKAVIAADEAPAWERRVREWCAARLPPYKVPSVVERVDRIPRLPSGKISRRELQKRSDEA